MTALPLFANSFDLFIRDRRAALLDAARYPGDDATEQELVAAASKAGMLPAARLVAPRVLPGKDAVSIAMYDAARLPKGVPGPAAVPQPMSKIHIKFTGSAEVLSLKPGVRTPPRPGWPPGTIEGDELVVVLPGVLRVEQVEGVHRVAILAAEALAQELTLWWQPTGWVIEHFREMQAAAKQRAIDAEKALRKLENIGYRMKTKPAPAKPAAAVDDDQDDDRDDVVPVSIPDPVPEPSGALP